MGGEVVVLPLSSGLNGLGSGSGNDLVVDMVGVSRDHAVIVVEADRIVLVDQGSKNGVFVNDRRVQRSEISDGDRLRLGPVELHLVSLHPDDATLAVELPSATAPPSGPAARDSHETETAALTAAGAGSGRWLGLARRFVEELAHPATDGLGSALAMLVREMGVKGALVASGFESGQLRVVAAAGRAGKLPAPRPVPSRATAAFSTQPGFTGLTLGSPQGGGSLWIFGDFPFREQSEPLLRLLLSACRLCDQSLSEVDETSAESPTELVFPDEYLPGTAETMRRLYERMVPLVRSELPVLIRGETGTGKELIARILHLSSARRRGPFVDINCAALPGDLLEAELFGIGERVATGVAGRRGRFLEAHGGTLFLDEVGEMSAPLQAKLLRVLQEGRVQPVGGRATQIDVRVLTATNADLERLMAEESFRRDLYFRIAGGTLEVPPLRLRRSDVPLLVEHFLRQSVRKSGRRVRGVTLRALQRLQAYSWPGNVRQLEHEIRRLVYQCPSGGAIDSGMLDEAIVADRGATEAIGAPSGDLNLARLEQRAITEAMRQSGSNQVQAAEMLGISRHALRRRLDRNERS